MDAILGATEGKDIDTGLPGDLAGGNPQSGHSIGKACAVHVEAQPVFLGHGSDGSKFLRGVEGPDLGWLGHCDHLGFRVVDVGSATDRFLDACRG